VIDGRNFFLEVGVPGCKMLNLRFVKGPGCGKTEPAYAFGCLPIPGGAAAIDKGITEEKAIGKF